MDTLKLKRITPLLLLSILIFGSCKKDPSANSSTTVAEDKANIQQLFDDVITDGQNLKAGCGIQAIDNFLNIDQGNALNQYWAETVYNTLENHLNITAYQTNRFNFSNHVGTHSYHSSNQQWTKTNTPSNQAVLQFPSRMSSTSNDVEATLTGYNDQQVSFDGYQYWLPTSFDLEGKVGNSSCLGLKLNSASYDNTSSSQIPVNADFVLTFAPFTFEVKANKITDTKLSFDIVVKNNGTEAFQILLTEVNILDDNYYYYYNYDKFTSVEGKIIKGDFEIPFTADFESARQLFNPSDVQINSLFDADILYKGNNIGDLDYESNNGNSDADILITYKDGTVENTSTFYDNFLEELEIILAEFTGPW